MLKFLKLATASTNRPLHLGPLEISVMEIIWTHGEASVRDVTDQLARPLAYTTVMTTLDRLFKKDLLARRKSERAFLYAPCMSRAAWERKRAGQWVSDFLANPQPSGEMLISCLVEAVSAQDEALLEQLETKVRQKREQLSNGASTL